MAEAVKSPCCVGVDCITFKERHNHERSQNFHRPVLEPDTTECRGGRMICFKSFDVIKFTVEDYITKNFII
jgi:hypothetical protein